MSQIIEVQVPDIGNFDSVDVIEVHIKPGDTIAVDDSLITLESDKASMDIPSTHAGTVKEVKIKVGDKVAKGSLILTLEAEGPATRASRRFPGPTCTATGSLRRTSHNSTPPTSPTSRTSANRCRTKPPSAASS